MESNTNSIIEKNIRCPSYINDIKCKNDIVDGRRWCERCSEIFVKKQIKYKKLEEKYYQENSTVPENFSHEKLLEVYSKLTQIIEIRSYILQNGFNPDVRDDGHVIRIDNIRKYKDLIEIEMTKKQKIEISDRINKERDERQRLETIKELERREELERIENREKIRILAVSQKPTETVKQEISVNSDETEFEKSKSINWSISIFMDIIEDFKTKLKNYLSPRLGERFLNAFILQFLVMNVFRRNASLKKVKKLRANNGALAEKMFLHDMEHDYFDKNTVYFDKRFHREGINSGSFQSSINPESSGKMFCNTTLLTVFLHLYRHRPEIPLPKWIKKVNFNPTELEIEDLRKWNKYYTPSIIQRREAIIKLIKTRKPIDWRYDLQSCVRTADFKHGGELAIYIVKTETAENYRIIYAIENDGNILEKTLPSCVNMADFIFPYTFVPIITLNPDILGEITDDLTREKQRALCINHLEIHGNHLYTFD